MVTEIVMLKKPIFKFFVIFLNLFSFFSFAENPLHVTLEPHFGFSSGEICEYLYDNSETARLLSKLEWERNLFLYGAEARISLNRFYLSADFSASIPKNFGDMKDSDWMNDSNHAMKTTYSKGQNNALENYVADLEFGVDFFPFNSYEEKKLVLTPFAGFHYSYDSFERKDAEGWYGQSKNSSDRRTHWWFEDEAEHLPNTYWNDSEGRYVTRKLAGISYERNFYSIFLGSRISLKVSDRITFSLGLAFSPYSYSEVKDIHYGNNPRHYKEVQKSYWNTTKISSGIAFSLSKRLEATVGANLFYSGLAKGSYLREGIKDSAYKTGGSQFSMSARIGVRVKIL